MEENCSESNVDSEIRDLNKNSWENTGRESSLRRWSSITETIQFAESDSSRNSASDTVETDKSGGKDRSTFRSSTDFSTTDNDGEIRTESYGDEIHEEYSQDEFELFEESDEIDSSCGQKQEEFLEKKLQILMCKKMCSQENKKKFQLTLIKPEVQMEYYKNKIHHLNKKCGQGKHKQEISVNLPPKKTKGEACQLENARNVERLKVNNILFKINKNNTVPVHQPQTCKQCRKLQGKLTEESYIRKKTEMLQKQQFEKDIEKHLYEKDSVTLIANIINCGPKPNDPPQEIWNRLLRKGQYS